LFLLNTKFGNLPLDAGRYQQCLTQRARDLVCKNEGFGDDKPSAGYFAMPSFKNLALDGASQQEG
jgi:hypothetical protein